MRYRIVTNGIHYWVQKQVVARWWFFGWRTKTYWDKVWSSIGLGIDEAERRENAERVMQDRIRTDEAKNVCNVVACGRSQAQPETPEESDEAWLDRMKKELAELK